VAQGGANPWYLVRGDARANSRSAHHDATIGVSFANRPADKLRDVREIYRVGGKAAKVLDLVAP
jgi:hypothetical protein